MFELGFNVMVWFKTPEAVLEIVPKLALSVSTVTTEAISPETVPNAVLSIKSAML